VQANISADAMPNKPVNFSFLSQLLLLYSFMPLLGQA